MERLIQSNLIIKFKNVIIYSPSKNKILYIYRKKIHSLQKVKLETTKYVGTMWAII